jgi:hypothetical protein
MTIAPLRTRSRAYRAVRRASAEAVTAHGASHVVPATPPPNVFFLQGGLSVGLGVSLILVAVGAILTWAVEAEVSGLDIQVIGVILMIVGIAGFLLSMMFWSSWGGPGYFGRRETYVEERPVERVEREVY